MGLLTDTSKPEKLKKFILKYHGILSALCYLVGLGWFIALAYNPNNAETYFSENALLPGLVDAEFGLEHDAKLFLERLQDEMESHESDMPTSWLQSQFRQLGLEVYLHNFNVTFPLGRKPATYGGHNVYAILRAPRAASTEALVLTAPFRPLASVLGGTAPGIAVMLAVAKFFSAKTYLAKDIIFLVTEHEQLGAKAWLEAYHGTKSSNKVLNAGALLGRSGNIQAAINLELHGQSIGYVDVKVEGLNGQLPNLDLFNLVVKLCKRESVDVTFHNRPSHYSPLSTDGWLNNLATMLSMVQSQATGVPTGNHGQFLSHNIEALTLEGHRVKRGRGASFQQLGRVVEGVFRSLNNLLESLHQSFFFYLLPTTDRYVSIGLYMIPFGFFLVAITLSALKLHLVLERAKDSPPTLSANDPSYEERSRYRQWNAVDCSLFAVIPCEVSTHLFGLVVLFSPHVFAVVAQRLDLTIENGILSGLLITFLLLLASHRTRLDSGKMLAWQLIKCAALLEMALLLATVSLVNFSLALLLAVFTTPIFLVMRPSPFFRGLLLLAASPLFLSFVGVVYATWEMGPSNRLGTLLQRGFLAWKRGITYSITDAYIFDNWLFSVASLLFCPIWLQMWWVTQAPDNCLDAW